MIGLSKLISICIICCGYTADAFSTPSFTTAPKRHVTSSPNWHNRQHSFLQSSPEEEIDYSTLEPQVEPQRWIQLGYLSALALVSDWICFSTAAAPSSFEQAYPGHSAASIIDIFLFTNVASCFFVTDVVARIGLAKAVKGAGLLMAVGCILRSGILDMGSILGLLPDGGVDNLVPYASMLAGTVCVGAAQPFFQCTPPMLSATWFASDERATSTAVALNFNQIGIATAFLVGGGMANTAGGLADYFTLITVISVFVAVGTLLQFQEKPKVPPSTSAIQKLISGEKEPPFIESVQKFFSTPGFTKALAAFICSISITNVVGAFIEEVMERGGITSQFGIDLAGAGFELCILLGGIVIGGYVDRSKKYKTTTLACLAATLFLAIPLGFTDHAMGQEPYLLVASLLGLGFAVGPVQPINAELAVDVTYPGDETAVESVQQIGGNLFSALLLPVAELASKEDFQMFVQVKVLESDIRGDVILLAFITLVTMFYFSSFDSPLRRTIADCGDDGTCLAPELNMDQMGAIDTTSLSIMDATGGVATTPTMSPETKAALQKLTKK
eukprot:CAMPEP_0194414936 /NCGR_PEP_ID=MMETSP0176-20130528/13695_1 /TAXON_ID=216777 /ORGANISM="Proboscia alata, Strain PI-D3" /LENGTH=557 /DNA_ID=CAMNT_0039219301 /DNA_START=170 /DNA_END=1843 /DNA_ORIENTATION=-